MYTGESRWKALPDPINNGTVNFCLLEPADFPEHIYCSTIEIPYISNETGLPVSSSELTKALKFEDRIIDVLSAHGQLFVGHRTGNGRIIAVFYGNENCPHSVTVKAGLFGKRTFEINSVLDKEWTTYLDWFKRLDDINPIDLNEELKKEFRRQGDDLFKPRDVTFAFLFPRPEDRDTFLKSLRVKDINWTINDQWEYESPDLESGEAPSFWCTIDINTPIDGIEFDSMRIDLEQTAEQHQGEMDGWEAGHG
ncbi:MAG: DUF695 domain-containing protein [Armatimonadetes bacterium]|nr:DUF695 domain-containing protein [Armatimonadota bacterium]